MNKNRYLLGIVLLLAGAMPMYSQVSNDNEDEVMKISRHAQNDYVEGQVLVKFKDESRIQVSRSREKFNTTNVGNLTSVLQKFGVEQMDQLLPNEKPNRKLSRARAYNGETIQEKDLSQLYLVKLSPERSHEVMPLIDELKNLDEVEFAEPNYKLYTLEEPIASGYNNNPMVNQQWYLDSYGVKELWNKPIINKERPVIAIIDTGVDITHPDLVDNLWTNTAEAEGEEGYDNDGNGFKGDIHGWDFISNTGNIRDNNMHGTHVAGIAAAANNGIGIVGANPQALIMPVTVMQSDGVGDAATIIKGIDYAVANGATVLNLSIGGYFNSIAMRQALEKAYQKAVIVAAAGNEGKCINTSHYPDPCKLVGPAFPAAYSFVLGVQATTNNGFLASFSNYDDDGNTYSSVTTLQDPDGFNYELKAPGTNILSTIPGGKYKELQGTSMAAPLVAGAISALKMVKQYDTQEILWGDLLHTDNIAQAYAVTSRPAELDLMKIIYRERKELSEETEEDYSNDGEIDAGETVNLYPVLRTTWGEAKNIKMHLEMGEYEDPDVVQILSGNVDFGLNLSSYGKAVSLNPLQLKVPSGIADGRHIRIKFVATSDNLDKTYEKEFVLVANNMVKINGLISEDRTLTANHVYLVNDNIGVMEGATLTIEPGTRLEFMENIGLSSYGKLVANGTPEKPIVFTGHKGVPWAGIKSHESTGEHYYNAALYTNKEQTLFTLLPTEVTPNKFTSSQKSIYYGANEENPQKWFYLKDYINDFSSDMTSIQNLLTDPNYLTPAVLQMLSDWKAYWSKYPTQYSADKQNSASVCYSLFDWTTYDNPRDTISYCKIDGLRQETADHSFYYPHMKDCIIDFSLYKLNSLFRSLSGERNNIVNTYSSYIAVNSHLEKNLTSSNIVNNYFGEVVKFVPKYSSLNENNYFNNSFLCNASGKYYGKYYSIGNSSALPDIDKATNPSYLGTGREDIARESIYEIGNAPDTYGQIDLSNMRTTPVAEAHGIVWKVCVNGKDAQDEFKNLAPLGVGKHKFEVYFNRPMNKAVVPQISFGVREPYTQNAVTEDGSWNDEGTIYTAYITITGKTKSDGINRIYVNGAEDNEFFEIPYEKTRFNIMINAAGSMATGFAAEAGLGRVNLTWNNTNNNFDDAMGFNIYRFNPDVKKTIPAHYDKNRNWIPDQVVVDTVRINQEIVDIETTAYTDYDVKPGKTYYYMYKVLSTDLKEFDVSNVVTATPLTSIMGDANGSGKVDVTDVMTTVNYALGMDQKPFIFEAADVNVDQLINVLDVVGIVQLVLHPNAARAKTAEEMASVTYSIEDGMLYLDTPVSIGGFQIQLTLDRPHDIIPTETLKGFEIASTWLTENDYRMMAYSFGSKTLPAGKHAVLHIGDAEITSLCLSDTQGNELKSVSGGPTGVEGLTVKRMMNTNGVFNLNGQKVSGSADALKALKHGVYIINGQKVVR